MEEEILLNIEFNSDEIKAAIKDISESRKQVDALTQANKELAKAGEKNSEAYVKNQESIKALNSSISANSKVVQANTQATDQSITNVEKLRKANAEMVKLKNKENLETEEGIAAIAKYNAEIEKNNEIIASTLNTDEKRIKNIGNYASALDGIHPKLGSFASELGGATEASGGLTKGIGSMIKASLSFIATPIGALIAALVLAFKALETFITGSTEGMDLFEDVTASVGVVIDVVTDRVVNLVSGIGKLLSGDFSAGLDQIESSFSGIGDEIEREIGLTLDLNKAIRDLEDAEINYDIAASETSNTIRELLLQAKNRSFTEAERSKKLTEATKLEEAQSKQQLANREEALRIANEEAALRVGIARTAGETEAAFGKRIIDTGKVLDDQRDKIKDAIIAYNNALGEGITFREKVQNQIDALAEKAEADAEKRRQERLKKEEEDAKKREAYAAAELAALNQLELARLTADAMATKGVEARTEKLVALEETRRKQLLADAELTESQRQLIIFESEQAILQIKRGAADQEKQAQAEDLAEALDSYKTYTLELVNAKKEELLQGKISQEQYNKEIYDLNVASLEAELLIKQTYGEADLELQGRITDQKIALSKAETDMKVKDEERKKQAVMVGLATIASAFNKQSVAFKVLASAQTLITTYQSAIAAFNSLANIPYVGTVLGIAAAAAATANGLAAVAQINGTQLPKLAEGGMVDVSGRSHAAGGEVVSISGRPVAEVEGGEKLVVLKRGAGELLRNLGFINSMAGGIDFGSDQSPRRYLDTGGIMARSAADKVNRLTSSDIAESFKDITIVTKVTDIDRVNDKREVAAEMSELS